MMSDACGDLNVKVERIFSFTFRRDTKLKTLGGDRFKFLKLSIPQLIDKNELLRNKFLLSTRPHTIDSAKLYEL